MNLWKWQPGRQLNCEYKKFPVWYFKLWRLGFDCYVLKYNGNQILPTHKDPIENGKHIRLNIGWGQSNFICEKTIFKLKIGKFSIFLFRPDMYQHSLTIFAKTIKISMGLAMYGH